MEIKPYKGKYLDVARLLSQRGALKQLPVQINRKDLIYDEGIDIEYRLKGMGPARFAEFSEVLLLAAFQEAERYKDERLRFAKFIVHLNRTPKGRKAVALQRDYVAAKHPDSDIMVYGEKALGYELPEEYQKRPYLINKVQDIIDIPDTPSPGAYVEKQKPYKVITMIICIRAGLSRRERREEQEALQEERLAEGKK